MSDEGSYTRDPPGANGRPEDATPYPDPDHQGGSGESVEAINGGILHQEDLKYRNGAAVEAPSVSPPQYTHESAPGEHDAGSQEPLESLPGDDAHHSGVSGSDRDEKHEAVGEKQFDEVDDSLLNDIERTLQHKGKSDSVNSLFIDMGKLKDSRSKSGSNRTESLRSRHSSKSHDTDRSKKKGSRKLQQFGTSENPIDITEMSVDCGSLLELYQNDYFDAFMHMYHLYHKKEPGVHEYLVNMLYTKRSHDEICFYLPQLCQLSISKYGKSSLHRFLLDKASMSMHFALQLSWFYQAAIDDQIPKYDRLTQKMTQDTEMAVVNCKLISPNSFSRPSSDMPAAENMSFPCLLDRRLLLESYSKRKSAQDSSPANLSTSVDSLLSPQMPTSLVHNTFTLSSTASKVKLLGVHTKLGNPLDLETHPILDYTDDLHQELQKLMMKQRRLNYFNTLNNFVALCMQNSSLLTTETKRESREPLLKVFASALNEWMLLRRSTVAAYEESFAYTGLSLPFKFLNEPEKSHIPGLNGYQSAGRSDQAYSQIIRIVERETKIFFSKKRAPFVFYVEMANLDEDIEYISCTSSDRDFSMRDLYVFDCIVEDLVSYDLITRQQVETIKNPLECIRFALDMLPQESLERYKNILDDKLRSDTTETVSPKAHTPDDSFSVSRASSSNGDDHVDNDQYSDSDFKSSETPYSHATNDSVKGAEKESLNGDSVPADTPLGGEPRQPEKEQGDSSKESPREREAKYPNVKNLSPQEVRNIVFTETFEQKKDRIRRDSPYGHLKSWDLHAFVVKGNDDLRQEKMANQVLDSFMKIFTKAKLPLWLRPIEILVTGSNSGIMEFLHDTYSVDVIKRKFNVESLAPVFEKLFHANLYEARKNFIESHAAYSIVSYLLQVKDRHNGNILLDPQGHVIHIDYGFCLSNFPGKLISFETSPFKLTKEYLDVIGGPNSDNFVYFKTLMIRGLLEARKHVDEIVLLVEMMTTANKMPCFLAGTTYTIEMFKERFMLNQSEEACIRKITEMIDASLNSFSTVQYDTYQRITNGIM